MVAYSSSGCQSAGNREKKDALECNLDMMYRQGDILSEKSRRIFKLDKS